MAVPPSSYGGESLMAASSDPTNPFRRRCVEVVQASEEALTSMQVMEVLQDEFPLCTWIDVHDELTAHYGPG